MTPWKLTLPLAALLIATGASLVGAQDIAMTRVTDGGLVDVDDWTYGAGWADYDQDGHLDLFVPHYDEPNELYRNDGDGTFTRVEGTPMAASDGKSIACAWADYDNDGWVDLFVACTAVGGVETADNELYRNDGDGTFTRITEGSLVTDTDWSLGAAWGDYDQDGRLDLFVANFREPNALYRNEGDGTFTRITGGDIATDAEASYTPSWVDFDLDGDLDLFVVNNLGSGLPADSNALYRNDDGVFVRVTDTILSQDGAESTTVSWADYDNDGDPDCFVGNQNWNGATNLLYRNEGDGTFTAVTGIDVVTDDTNNFGSEWVDVDNDGWIDLTVTANQSGNRFNKLYRNNGDGTFTSVSGNAYTDDEERSLGQAWADFDGDGWLDVYVTEQSDPNQLYRNTTANGNHWVALRLHGLDSSADGLGARVVVTAGGTTQTRWHTGTRGSYGGSVRPVHFGLGADTTIDAVEIFWPSGAYQVVAGLQVDAINDVHEENTVAVDDPVPGETELPTPHVALAQNHPNPFNPSTTIAFSLDRPGHVRLSVHDLSGRLIAELVNAPRAAGSHEIRWHGTDRRGQPVPSGTYLYRLDTTERSLVRTMTLLK